MNELKETTLLLVQTVESDYAYIEWKRNNFNTEIIMKPVGKLIRIIRRIWILLNFPGQSIWYGAWKHQLAKYNTVIVHASAITLGLPKWIKRKNSNIRVILWYWNPVNKNTIPSPALDKYCEKWSFDIKDCQKYNMRYNSQYYFKTKKLPINKESTDIFFIGSEKGRATIIENIYDICKSYNIKTDFNIVTKRINKIHYKELISNYMTYDEILVHISKTKAILEILQQGQSSPTLRTFEALFFSKKLITNNLKIKEFDFYNENNIFIIGEDDISKLSEFLLKPYKNIDDKIIAKYDVNAWFGRFFENCQRGDL